MHIAYSCVALALVLGANGAQAAPRPAKAHPNRIFEVPLQRSLSQQNKPVESDYSFGTYAEDAFSYKHSVGKKRHFGKPCTRPRGIGTVPLSDKFDDEIWTGSIAFGSPPQEIVVGFDTGSGVTLISTDSYNPNASSTSVDTGVSFTQSYGDGTTHQGEGYWDTVTWGGLSVPKVPLALAPFKATANPAQKYGILGMGLRNTLRPKAVAPLFYHLIDAGVVDEPAFTMKLRTSGSSLTLGAKSKSATYLPTIDRSSTHWVVNASINSHPIKAMLDSGTTNIIAPYLEAQSFFHSLRLQTYKTEGALQGVYNCSTPPQVSVQVGDKTIKLSSDSLHRGKDDHGQCIMTIVGMKSDPSGVGGWILGDPFFRNTVISFDVGNEQVGFD